MSVCDICSSASGLMLPWVLDNKTQIACMACRARYPQASDVVDWAARYNIAVAELICFRAERDALATRLAQVERERDEAPEVALLPIRRVLFTRGFCGDGGLTAMVVRALEESQERGRVENREVLAALLEASDAFPPDMEGTVAARVRLLLARAEAAEAEFERLRTGWDEHIGAFKDEILDTRRIAEEALDAWEWLWTSDNNDPPPAAIKKMRQRLSELRGDYPDSAAIAARAKGG